MADQQTPNVGQVVNQAISDGNMGITGIALKISQLSILAIFCGVLIWLLHFSFEVARADRLDDRQMFRDEVKTLQDQADRHTGEIKGALDANTSAMKDLIAEFKLAKTEHRGTPVPQSSPRQIKPP